MLSGMICNYVTLFDNKKIFVEKKYNKVIAGELSIREQQVQAVLELLADGSTIPFIARYRKEATGSLDEVIIAKIGAQHERLQLLGKRRAAILKSIEEQGKLTDTLKEKLEGALTLAELEDIYLPYKPKRRTRAVMAREKGLEPLAEYILGQPQGSLNLKAGQFIDPEKGVEKMEDALQGARDIIAERINEDAGVRKRIRELFTKKGVVYASVIKGKETEGMKYRDYFDWESPVNKVASYRMLALRRGEKEMVLRMDIRPPEEDAFDIINNLYVKGDTPSSQQVRDAGEDAYKRLLKSSIETEIRLEMKKKADEDSVRVFTDNLRQLLLAPPLGQKRILAIDPGFRTGCKVVCLDPQGRLLHHTAIFPHEPKKQVFEASKEIRSLCEKYEIEAIAIGNGTAGRETEQFVRSLGLSEEVMIVMVNESGASVYSASEIARKEFPDKDVTVRGAVSIGRRLMDPLAELVKIDPRSIGVGQYQHDVDQVMLKKGLEQTVESCVNAVGVEVNTASAELLSYVSGLGPVLAANIIEYRNQNGPFTERTDLKNVPRFGEKVFEQAAGFIRIRGGKNPLDASAVHPERYGLVQEMADDLRCTVDELIASPELRKRIVPEKYVSEEAGLPTVTDILNELEKPGRDPRKQFESIQFLEGVNEIGDLKVGMVLDGVVTNITDFGAFVDIGVHQDGLVHKSQIADRFVVHPADELTVQQKVKVTVVGVEVERKRISLSMKKDPFSTRQEPAGKKKKRPENKASMEDKLSSLKNKFRK